MRIHFVGIGGEGMCGVAKIALAYGHEVSGSEIAPKRWLDELRQLGARIYYTHSPMNVQGAELVVQSSGISSDHVEVETAKHLAIPVIKRARALGMLLRDNGRRLISIAGSHGKSTITAMVGQILEIAGLDPTVVVGAYVPYFASHVRVGQGQLAVVEACEFDRSFLELGGFSSIVTSIEPDHLDYYRGGISEIVDAFAAFVELTSRMGGLLIACADDEMISTILLRRYSGRAVSYGINSGDWRARCLIGEGGIYPFLVEKYGHSYGAFSLCIPGNHNIQNALAAIVLADSLGIGSVAIQQGLSSYKGIHRRYEKRFVSGSTVVIDDYGHSPIEIEAVVKAIRQEFPEAYVVCVPCLRQFHRTRQRLDDFATVLATADACIVAPIIAGLGDNELTKKSVTSNDVANAISVKGCVAVACCDEPSATSRVIEVVKSAGARHCAILAIGSGRTENIVRALCQHFQSQQTL